MPQVTQSYPFQTAAHEPSNLQRLQGPLARVEHLQQPPAQMIPPHAENGRMQWLVPFSTLLNSDISAVNELALEMLRVPNGISLLVPPGRPRQADEARTALGRKLRELRTAIVASGAKLLNWDELEHEIAERRGDDES